MRAVLGEELICEMVDRLEGEDGDMGEDDVMAAIPLLVSWAKGAGFALDEEQGDLEFRSPTPACTLCTSSSWGGCLGICEACTGPARCREIFPAICRM